MIIVVISYYFIPLLVMIESPTNPIQRICDIEALAGNARVMVVDNVLRGIGM